MSHTRHIRRTATALLLPLALAGAPAQAFEIDTFFGSPVGWAGNNMTVRASAVSFPAGSSFTTALSSVLSRWNNNPSRFNFSLVTGDTSVGHGNFQDEVWFAADADGSEPPAECWSWSLFGDMVEADVVFYTNTSWTTSTSKTAIFTYGGSRRPFQTTAMHEFGHALGLNHENDEYNIMGEDWTHIHLNGNTTRSYFGEDAADGAVAIYGTDANAGQDVSVVHMERSGQDGEYSLHDFTDMTSSTGAALSSTVLTTGELRYDVDRGQRVRAEFSFENNGRSTQTVSVRYVISTNNIISTFDTTIATLSLTLGRANVFTRTQTLTIPSNLNVGQDYWLGVIVDDTATLVEFDESNNAANLPIHIDG